MARVLIGSSFDRLKAAFNLATNTPTSVVESFTTEQWLTLSDAFQACSHDLTPDHWTTQQIELALSYHITPQFKEVPGDDSYPITYDTPPHKMSRDLWNSLPRFGPSR